MFEQSEVLCLLLAIPLGLPALVLSWRLGLPHSAVFFAAGTFAFAAAVFTVAEHVLWPGLFNALEHICYALAGLGLGTGSWMLARRRRPGGP